jgi:PAS domain S-box-containing protein
MGDHGRVFSLVIIMALVVVVTSGAAMGILYQTAFDQQRQALVQMAKSQARLIESVAKFDQKFSKFDHPDGPMAATLEQVRDAQKQYPGMGTTGEFTLAKRKDNQIVFLLRHRHFDFDIPKPIPFDGLFAEPMRRALSGNSGSVIGLDYRGQAVLAAHEPVAILNLGIVAKIDLSEIREPFIIAGMNVGVIALVVIIAGTALFIRISNPLIQQIVKEKERAEEYLHIAEAIIVILDKNAKILRINRRGCDVLGYREDEIVGKNWIETVIPEISRETISQVHAKVISGEIEPVEHHENEVLTKNGELRNIVWHNAYVTDDRNRITGSLSSGQDITERKRGERALLRAKEAADKASIAKSELMANMSHELRTPLNAIIGFSSAMKEEVYGPLDEKYREYLGDIHQSGSHLLELINDILDVSALEAGALELKEENVILNDIAVASVNIVSQLATDGQVTITLSFDPEIPLIRGDARRLKQVLLNLLSNAVKFTQPGGVVSLSTQRNDDNSVSLIVADSGIGMDKDELEKALSMFGQVDSGLDRQHEGTGLGLPLSKGLMEMHDGMMEVESEKGQGTVITLTLPKQRILKNA